VAKLADALDLGSSALGVQVQILSPAPSEFQENDFVVFSFLSASLQSFLITANSEEKMKKPLTILLDIGYNDNVE
jgi:hypothetical protein